ncbi:hypothetical protein JCM10213_003158 [Rhodosporidiobolus nylandii]
MASFASLPPELVEEVVELAVPPFSPSSWKERARTLKALCLTCQQTYPAARKLLYREVVLDSPAAVVLLALTMEVEKEFATSSIIASGGAAGATDGEAGAAVAFIRLVERARPALIKLYDGRRLPVKALDRLQYLQVDNFDPLDGRIHSPLAPSPSPVSSSLRRLHINHTFVREPGLLFTGANLPGLRSLSVDDKSHCYLPGYPIGPLEPQQAIMPVVTQLHSVSAPHPRNFSASTALAVLEVSSAHAAQHFNLLRLPPSVRVIRLRILHDATVDDLNACLSYLTCCDISNLLELHLVEAVEKLIKPEALEIVELVEALKKHCQAEQVALIFFSSPPDEDASFPSFGASWTTSRTASGLTCRRSQRIGAGRAG